MTQQVPRLVWRGSPEIIFAVGLVIVIMASFGLYDRFRLEANGVSAEGIVQRVTLSCLQSPAWCRRATDLVVVTYQDDAGQSRTRTVYARSHEYSEGQTIKLKYLLTDRYVVGLARGERGDADGSLFQVTIGGVMTALSGIFLIMKWGRRMQR